MAVQNTQLESTAKTPDPARNKNLSDL